MEPTFLTLDEVLEIHTEQIERYGGLDGIRDLAGLESAIAAPRMTFGSQYLHCSVPAMGKPELIEAFKTRCWPLEGN